MLQIPLLGFRSAIQGLEAQKKGMKQGSKGKGSKELQELNEQCVG